MTGAAAAASEAVARLEVDGSAPLADPAARVLRRFRRVFSAVRSHFHEIEKHAGIGGARGDGSHGGWSSGAGGSGGTSLCEAAAGGGGDTSAAAAQDRPTPPAMLTLTASGSIVLRNHTDHPVLPQMEHLALDANPVPLSINVRLLGDPSNPVREVAASTPRASGEGPRRRAWAARTASTVARVILMRLGGVRVNEERMLAG